MEGIIFVSAACFCYGFFSIPIMQTMTRVDLAFEPIVCLIACVCIGAASAVAVYSAASAWTGILLAVLLAALGVGVGFWLTSYGRRLFIFLFCKKIPPPSIREELWTDLFDIE